MYARLLLGRVREQSSSCAGFARGNVRMTFPSGGSCKNDVLVMSTLEGTTENRESKFTSGSRIFMPWSASSSKSVDGVFPCGNITVVFYDCYHCYRQVCINQFNSVNAILECRFVVMITVN